MIAVHPASSNRRGLGLWLGLVLAAVTLFVYYPVASHEFVSYDDPDFVTANPMVQSGLTVEGFKWVWQSEVARNWHPVTMLSHMLDCQFFGLHPGPAHLVNVLLHVANALLLFQLLRMMTGFAGRSFCVAALFALHPLHVESVAWIAERKDVFSTFFWFLTFWAYVCYGRVLKAGGGKWKMFYALALVFFALGLMCKPMLVTGPFVLWILDFWPLRRLVPEPAAKGMGATRPAPAWLIWEKIPFLAMSAALCVITYSIQKNGGAMLSSDNLPFTERFGNALVSYWRYIGHLFFPVHLNALNLHSGAWPVWAVGLAGAGLVGVSIIAIMQRSRRPWLLTGWFWYLGTLVPVIGFVQVGMQSMADRFTYVPLIGLFVILVWGAAEWAGRWRQARVWVPVAVCAGVVLGMVLTRRQMAYWTNSETLFSRMIEVNTNNYMAHYNLANVYSREKRAGDAEVHYLAAIAAEPGYAEAQNNFAGLLLEQKRYDESILHYREAVRLSPQYLYHFNLANALADAASARHDAGEFAAAVQAYEQTIQLNPASGDAHNNLGLTWQAQGKEAEAMAEFREAMRVQPGLEPAHFNLANSLARAGNLDGAILEYQTAEKLNPARAENYNDLGVCYGMKNKMAEAEAQFKELLCLQPGNGAADGNLGNVLAAGHKVDEAILYYSAALRINPQDYQTEFNLGLTLSGQGRRSEAESHFKQALLIKPDYTVARKALQDLAGDGKGQK
jgi:tetratricopeptide (TPR) repeat protein